LDDILVFSNSAEEHLQHLRKVFELLRENQFYGRLPKCEFNMPKLKYVGHIVGNGQLSTDPKKVKTVTDWPAPKSVKEVRQFLGLAQWFRRFIHHFAELSLPLTALLRKEVQERTFEWTAAAQASFDAVKQALCTAPVLVLPDWNRPFEVMADASKFALGAVLMQDGHPVAMMHASVKFLR
jgi:hypothetical protein